MAREPHDYDWIVVGSGFGGSVAALRLAEKGYRVAVVECGRRFEDDDFARSTWNWRRFLWMPRLGLKGILRFSFFKDATILTGSGVGGGSLVYANTLYRAPDRFFSDPQWAHLADWKAALEPHYDTAERMLGANRVPFDDPGDRILRDLAVELGVEDTYGKTDVGVLFGEPGRLVDDPYFSGEGPPRRGCVRCGACMVGCRFNAKNTLMKNYLYLAEGRGVRILPERQVVDIAPLDADDGGDGYAVTHRRTGAWGRGEPRVVTAGGVVLAAGALGTNGLLRRCKESGSLPRLSDRLGWLVRTNSEAILAVTARDDSVDFSDRVAITSSIYPNPDTHIETVTYGRGGNSMRLLFALLTGEGSRLSRPFKLLRQLLSHPGRWGSVMRPGSWSRRTLILLVMQTLDNSMRLKPVKLPFGGAVALTTEQDPDKPNPTFIPAANEAAERIAASIDGVPQSSIIEAVAGIPTTAHVLGGAVIAEGPEGGVVDPHARVFGYRNMLVADGAAMPANPGVNPSLTITAMAEHALSHVPEKEGAPPVPPVRLSPAPKDTAPEPAPGTASGPAVPA